MAETRSQWEKYFEGIADPDAGEEILKEENEENEFEVVIETVTTKRTMKRFRDRRETLNTELPKKELIPFRPKMFLSRLENGALESEALEDKISKTQMAEKFLRQGLWARRMRRKYFDLMGTAKKAVEKNKAKEQAKIEKSSTAQSLEHISGPAPAPVKVKVVKPKKTTKKAVISKVERMKKQQKKEA